MRRLILAREAGKALVTRASLALAIIASMSCQQFLAAEIKPTDNVNKVIKQSQEQTAKTILGKYFADDVFIARLDGDNRSVINHFGTNALYDLASHHRRLQRGARSIGIEDVKAKPALEKIQDEAWHKMMNKSKFLNRLYPEELKIIRELGFNAFNSIYLSNIELEDRIKNKVGADELLMSGFSESFAPNQQEQIDKLIDSFMLNSDNMYDLEQYQTIAEQIQSPNDLSPKSRAFLSLYSLSLSLEDRSAEALEVAVKLYTLSAKRWRADALELLKPMETLLNRESTKKTTSLSGRSKFQYNLSNSLSELTDHSISLVEEWWGPDSPKLMPLLLAKAEFFRRDNGALGSSIIILERVNEIYVKAKDLQTFSSYDEQATDYIARSAIMSVIFSDVERGDYESAFNRILRFKTQVFNNDTTDHGISFGGLFSDLVNAGKYAEMIDYAEKLIGLYQVNKLSLNDEELYSIKQSLAFCYIIAGRFEEFDELLIELDKKDPLMQAMQQMSLINRGVLPDVKYPLLQLDSDANNISFEFAAIQHMIAMIVEAANKNYQASIEVGENLYSYLVAHTSSINPHAVSTLLSGMFFANGDQANGIKYLRKMVEHKNSNVNTINLDDQMGIAALKLDIVAGDYTQTRNQALSNFELWLDHLQTELARMPIQERTSYMQSGWASIKDTEALNLLLTSTPMLDQYPDLVLFYILNRKGLLEEIENRQRLLISTGKNSQDIYEQIRNHHQVIADGGVRGEDLSNLKLKINALERELYRLIPRLKPRTYTVEEVRRVLPADGALVEYIRYQWADPLNPTNKEVHYAAMLLRPNGVTKVFQLGKSKDIEAMISASIQSIEEQHSDSESLLNKAIDKVLSPLLPELDGVRVLYVSPDGEVNRLPFASAKVGAGGDYLTDQMNVRVLTTGRELLQLQESAPQAVSAPVVIADPSFDRAAVAAKSSSSKRTADTRNTDPISNQNSQRALGLDQIWTRLKSTEEEGKATSKLIGGTLWVGNQASAKNVKTLTSPLIAHFATHGFFMPDQQDKPVDGLSLASLLPVKPDSAASNPLLRSGIVMAGANQPDADPDDDGYLTALEVLQLDWQGTELVVVSACESGRGVVNRGEGLYGLKRAFAVAGARSSLLSLWKVDDAATAAFMESFYQRLKAGEGKAAALAATQKEFRSHPIAAWRHPYVWAAFQLSGDWGPVAGI